MTNAIKYCRMSSLIFKGVIIMTKEKIIAARIDKIIQILEISIKQFYRKNEGQNHLNSHCNRN